MPFGKLDSVDMFTQRERERGGGFGRGEGGRYQWVGRAQPTTTLQPRCSVMTVNPEVDQPHRFPGAMECWQFTRGSLTTGTSESSFSPGLYKSQHGASECCFCISPWHHPVYDRHDPQASSNPKMLIPSNVEATTLHPLAGDDNYTQYNNPDGQTKSERD